MPLNKDSLANTFLVATVLCLVCAALVSTAAVSLKPIKNQNILKDRRTNILAVSGFTPEQIQEGGGVEKLFMDRFETLIIDLDSGQPALDDCQAALEKAGKQLSDVLNDYDQQWCSKSKKPSVSDELSKDEDIVGIKYREKFSHVYILKSSSGEIEKYVFPVRGYGLWSMMQGYLSLEPDLQTVAGLTFYDQAETPGLGGEVMNPQWKAKWPGKQVYQDEEVALSVSKGDQSSNPYGVDALSGATITSKGVSNLIEFWMGPKGFGPYIDKQSASNPETAAQTGPAGVHHG